MCIRDRWTLSFVLPNALRAANDVKFTMIVSILSMAVWRLGFSYMLCVRMGWGAVGVWIAMIIDWVCRVTCFVLRLSLIHILHGLGCRRDGLRPARK